MNDENKKKSDDIQRKRFMLTINNPKKYEMSHEKIIEAIHSAFAKQGIIYFCLCDEIGESGTYHTHIFIMITKKKRWSAVQNAFPHAHIETEVRGTAQEVVAYIKKEGKKNAEKKETNLPDTFYEEGDLPTFFISNKRAEMIDQIHRMIEDGMTPDEIMAQHTIFVDYETVIRKSFIKKRFRQTPVERDVRVVYHVGEAGSGKTHVYTQLSKAFPNEVYLASDMLGNCKSLFDNYCCQKIVFVDEVKPAAMPYSFLLQILDKYRCEIHARYSNVFSVYDEIHISSVFPPELLYKNLNDVQDTTIDSLNQLLRRITTIVYHYKKENTYFTFELPGDQYRNYDDLKQKALGDRDGFLPADQHLPF